MKNTSNKRPALYVVGILFLICYLLRVYPTIHETFLGFNQSVNRLIKAFLEVSAIMLPVGFLCRKPKVSGIGFFVSAISCIWGVLSLFNFFAEPLREGLREGLIIRSFCYIYTKCHLGYIVWCLLLAVACFTPKHISRVLIFIASGTMLLCVVICAANDSSLDIIVIGRLCMYICRAIATLVWGFASIEAPAKVSPSAAAGVNTSPVERLIKLKALLDDGTISREDFEQKKKEIIGL